MKVEVDIPAIQVPLDQVKGYLPDIKRLEKIAAESPIKEDVTRRVIKVVRDNQEGFRGYSITDWNGENYLGYRNFDK